MSNPVILRDEIKRRTDHLTFGYAGLIPVNASAWADVTERLGADADWAVDWIKRGYPEPMEWLKQRPSGCVAFQRELAKK